MIAACSEDLSDLRACGQVCVTSPPSSYWGEVIIAVAEGVRGDWVGEARARVATPSRHKHPRAHVGLEVLPVQRAGQG